MLLIWLLLVYLDNTLLISFHFKMVKVGIHLGVIFQSFSLKHIALDFCKRGEKAAIYTA